MKMGGGSGGGWRSEKQKQKKTKRKRKQKQGNAKVLEIMVNRVAAILAYKNFYVLLMFRGPFY